MLRRINWKAVLKGFAWLTCLAGVVVLMSFISVKRQEVKCTNVKILIPGADNFIEREEIDAILKQGEGQLIGRSLEEIDLHQIETMLKANPYIAFAKIYADMDGVINIEIKQRQPVLRILNAGGQDFYIDNDGLKMPMSPNFTANVLVATGNILEGFGGRVDTLLTGLASDLYKTAMFIKKDTLWDAQIEQIYVNEKQDIELVPRVGNQRIILGTADSLQTKMRNLLAFYKQAMPKVGWNAYRTINLKYNNQIVCEKADSTKTKKEAPIVKIDSSLKIQSSIDSLVKSEIQNEIKKQAVTAQQPAVAKPKVEAKQPDAKEKKAPANTSTGNEKAKEKATAPVKEKVAEKTKAAVKNNTVGEGAKAKSNTTKEKTDTKKLK